MALRSTQPPPSEHHDWCKFCNKWRTWPYAYQADSFPDKYREFCFQHAFWHELLDRINDPEIERVDLVAAEGDGIRCFSIGDPPVDWTEKPSSLGFGGAWWHIEYVDKNGETQTVYTNNLWSRGSVPEDMVDVFSGRTNVRVKRAATAEEIRTLMDKGEGQ